MVISVVSSLYSWLKFGSLEHLSFLPGPCEATALKTSTQTTSASQIPATTVMKENELM